jgi:hypothetical protein
MEAIIELWCVCRSRLEIICVDLIGRGRARRARKGQLDTMLMKINRCPDGGSGYTLYKYRKIPYGDE